MTMICNMTTCRVTDLYQKWCSRFNTNARPPSSSLSQSLPLSSPPPPPAHHNRILRQLLPVGHLHGLDSKGGKGGDGVCGQGSHLGDYNYQARTSPGGETQLSRKMFMIRINQNLLTTSRLLCVDMRRRPTLAIIVEGPSIALLFKSIGRKEVFVLGQSLFEQSFTP